MLEQSAIVSGLRGGISVPLEDMPLDAAIKDKISKNLVRLIQADPMKGEALLEGLLETLSDLQKKNTKLEEMALTDSLTGAYNRRHFDNIMQEIDSERVRHERKKTGKHYMLLVDLDDFKFINDTYGHAAGDAALQHIAGILSKLTRKTDSICRFGGDEFVGVLYDTTLEGAIRKIDAIDKEINTSFMVWNDVRIPVRASIGSAEMDDNCVSADVLKRVDAQLYESKKAKAKRKAR